MSATEIVKMTGNAVTICSTLGYGYVHDVRDISHVVTQRFDGWTSSDTGKQYPAESAVDIWLKSGEEKGEFHTVRVKCAADEAVSVAAELIAALEVYNSQYDAIEALKT